MTYFHRSSDTKVRLMKDTDKIINILAIETRVIARI